MASADHREVGGPLAGERPADRPALARRLLWFVGLWIAGVAAISAVGLIIKLMLKG
jgi:hypothetical protein